MYYNVPDRLSLFDVKLAGDAVAYMANLPLSVNVLSQVSFLAFLGSLLRVKRD